MIRAFLLYFFSSKYLFIIFQVFLQEIRYVEFIGTSGLAYAAVDAVLDLQHLILPVFRKPILRRRTPYHLAHSRALVDRDVDRARHAVSASSAELA